MTEDRRSQHTLSGDVRLFERFQSRFLAHPRPLWIYLPPQYQRETRSYPVLYLHDGQNIFDGATAYLPGEEWGVDEAAERLIANGRLDPLIVVAIGNTGQHRIHEYAPVRDPRRGAGGLAHAYGWMLVSEIKPLIDGLYRTMPGVETTGVGGSSMGGLLTMYLGLSWPHVFGRLAVMSPSVWWANGWLLTQVGGLPKKTGQRIWLDVGLREGEATVRNVRALRDELTRKGWKPGRDLHYMEAREGDHSERAWAARAGAMLQFLYPARRRRGVSLRGGGGRDPRRAP